MLGILCAVHILCVLISTNCNPSSHNLLHGSMPPGHVLRSTLLKSNDCISYISVSYYSLIYKWALSVVMIRHVLCVCACEYIIRWMKFASYSTLFKTLIRIVACVGIVAHWHYHERHIMSPIFTKAGCMSMLQLLAKYRHKLHDLASCTPNPAC